MVDVSRDDDKIVNQCRRRNLLVQRVLGIRYTKPTPHMGGLLIQGQDSILVYDGQLKKPPLQFLRLWLG